MYAETEQQEKELNKQLRNWQKRQLMAVRKGNIDEAYAAMNEIDSVIWEVIANAESYKDVNWIVWGEAERIITKYCKLAR